MNILLLAGNSEKNQEWIHGIALNVSDLFDNTKSHQYAHWSTSEESMDIEYESQRVSSELQQWKRAEYVVFAKSAGCIVALKAIMAIGQHPAGCVFTGLPMRMIEKVQYPVRSWLQSASFPITIIQNEHDPLGSFEEVSDYIQKHNNPLIHILKSDGNTHDYTNIRLIRSTLESQRKQPPRKPLLA